MAENLKTRQVTYIARFWISLPPTTTSQKKYLFSSDHRSQTLQSEVSTWMGDRLGIPRVVGFKCFTFGFAFLNEGCFPYHCFLNQNFKHYASFL